MLCDGSHIISSSLPFLEPVIKTGLGFGPPASTLFPPRPAGRDQGWVGGLGLIKPGYPSPSFPIPCPDRIGILLSTENKEPGRGRDSGYRGDCMSILSPGANSSIEVLFFHSMLFLSFESPDHPA